MTAGRWRLGRRARLALTGAALLTAYVGWRVTFPGRAFDAAEWRDAGRVPAGVRLEMADRLAARGALRGMTRDEVVEMLGEPSRSGYFAEWDLVYWLGQERNFFPIDSEWLVVRLGADGRVTESRIVTD